MRTHAPVRGGGDRLLQPLRELARCVLICVGQDREEPALSVASEHVPESHTVSEPRADPGEQSTVDLAVIVWGLDGSRSIST